MSLNPTAYSASLKPMRFATPGSIVFTRFIGQGDKTEDVVLLPQGNGFIAFDTNGNPVTLTQAEMLSAIGAAAVGAEGETFITCEPAGTGTENAANLTAAMALAATLTPNGLALGPTNLALVIIPSGLYDYGDNPWPVSSPYIRYFGIGMPVIRRTFADPDSASSTGLLVRSADYVEFENLVFECNAELLGPEDETENAIYYPTASGANVRFRNCIFRTTPGGDMNNGVGARFDWNYDETFEDCRNQVTYFGGSPSGSSTITATIRRCRGELASGAQFLISGDCNFGGLCEHSTFSLSGGPTIGATGRVLYCTGGTWPTPATGGKVRFCLNGDFTEANLG